MAELLSPLTGRVVPLDSVPDPVFAQRMVGDGVAIEPTDSVVCAPVAGEVAVLFPSGHALAIATAEGLEVLVHLGIDSSHAPEAFTPQVAVGDRVQAGQPLLQVDWAGLQGKARSVLSPVLILNVPAGSQVETLAQGLVTAGKDPLLRLIPGGDPHADS